MHVDIIIFAVITFLLILKLKSLLGVKPDDDESDPHIVIKGSLDKNLGKVLEINTKTFLFDEDTELETEKVLNENLLVGNVAEIKENLDEIIEADKSFDLDEFIEGAKYAFEIIVTAYSRGDKGELKPLLSHKLYDGFSAVIDKRQEQGRSEETEIKNIEAVVSAAYLKGTMAYITVNYNVKKTITVKADSETISNSEDDNIITSSDIWTFTRDTRDNDPNWILIETKAS